MGDGGAPIAFESTWLCAQCGAQMIPRDKNARYCGKRCYERAQYERDRAKPEHVEEDRTRSKRWRERNVSYHNLCCALRKRKLLTPERREALAVLKDRGEVARDEIARLLHRIGCEPAPSPAPEVWIEDGPTVWERPSPTLAHLPLTAARLRGPLPKAWNPAYGYRLFSALSRALKIPHRSDRPTHATIYDGGWWAMCWPESLAKLPHSFVLVTQQKSAYREERIEIDSTRHRLRAPAPVLAGQYRTRLVLLTPLVVRAASRLDSRHVRTDDLVDLRGPLAALSNRLGVPHHESELHATVRMRRTETVECRLGGHVQRTEKRGMGVGLLGELLVECNAPALWLLRCAKLVGLGSDTSRGFGRVRLEDA
jgi:hypothetical protein